MFYSDLHLNKKVLHASHHTLIPPHVVSANCEL